MAALSLGVSASMNLVQLDLDRNLISDEGARRQDVCNVFGKGVGRTMQGVSEKEEASQLPRAHDVSGTTDLMLPFSIWQSVSCTMLTLHPPLITHALLYQHPTPTCLHA